MDLKRKKLIILTISIAICIIGVGSIFIINYVRASNVAEVVTVEAGSQMPMRAFFTAAGRRM